MIHACRTGSPTIWTPNDMTESESLLIGTNFGVVTDIETAPDSLVVVSISSGAISEIHRKVGRH